MLLLRVSIASASCSDSDDQAAEKHAIDYQGLLVLQLFGRRRLPEILRSGHLEVVGMRGVENAVTHVQQGD